MLSLPVYTTATLVPAERWSSSFVKRDLVQSWRVRISVMVLLLCVLMGGLYRTWRNLYQSPLEITGPNILPNHDFTLHEPQAKIPTGWIPGAAGVELRPDVRYTTGPSMQIQGINNFLRSPRISVCEGSEYRVAFRALSDQVETRVRVLFHWQDADDLEFLVTKGEWQSVPVQRWNTISAQASAPATAQYISFSIHPASDDVIFVDDVSMGQDSHC